MRTKIRWIIMICFMLIGIVTAKGQGDTTLLSFENALQIMQDQNPALQRARQQIKQKEYEKAAKKGLYMPQVSVGAKAVSMSESLHLDLTPVRDAILPVYDVLGNYGVFSGVPNPDPRTNTVMPTLPEEYSTPAVRQQLLEGEKAVASANWDQVIQEKNFASVTADIVWPIYTGGKIQAANKAAGVEVRIGQEELRQAEGELLSELVTRYYGLALAIQAVQVREQMFGAMDKHYSDAQKMFNEGMIAKVEMLHASVMRNEAERELKQSKRNIEIIQSGLMATLSLDSVSNILPASHLFINKNLPGLDFWIAKSFEANPKLKQIEGKKELADIKSQVEKGNYLPTVALLGTYNLADKNLSAYAPDWLVGVGLQWSVFEGLTRNNNVKASRTLQEQVIQAETQAHDNLQAYLTKLHQELNMQLEQIKELEGTLELANEYCSSTEKAFREGFSTSTAVTDAHTKIAQVKMLRLKVYFDYDLTLATLLQTAGVPQQYLSFCSGENTIVEKLNK